jgi:hypothetical protein
MFEDWTTDARRELIGLRAREGGWAYRRGVSASAEPSALAGLALLATQRCGSTPDPSDPELRAIVAASDWLARTQRPDGSLGATTAAGSPGWMTPYALLLWSALGVHDERRRRAAAWLLAQKGRTLDPSDDPGHIAGHDTTLIGWPWVSDTHSWLEPTAVAVLALGRQGLGQHPRVMEGLQLIRDRQIVTGGWNYGNKAVFGRALRAQPAPTGMALLALSGIDPRSPSIDRPIRYVTAALPGVRASASLGWGLVGLRAWGERPDGANRWLGEAHAGVAGRADAAPKLSCLLLAAGETTLELFGRLEGQSKTPGSLPSQENGEPKPGGRGSCRAPSATEARQEPRPPKSNAVLPSRDRTQGSASDVC